MYKIEQNPRLLKIDRHQNCHRRSCNLQQDPSWLA